MPDSFYPALRRVFGNSTVKWVATTLGTALLGVFSLYLWPALSAWTSTRVGKDDLEKVETRLAEQESIHAVNYQKLDLANTDDTGALSHGSRMEWLIIRVKRLQQREVQQTRRLICSEAKLRMPNPRSDAARATCKSVTIRYDELIKERIDPAEAGERALDFVFGSD